MWSQEPQVGRADKNGIARVFLFTRSGASAGVRLHRFRRLNSPSALRASTAVEASVMSRKRLELFSLVLGGCVAGPLELHAMPSPRIFGSSARMLSAMSTGRWLMSNSARQARARNSPRLARRYLSPNEAWMNLALSVLRTISGIRNHSNSRLAALQSAQRGLNDLSRRPGCAEEKNGRAGWVYSLELQESVGKH